MFIVIFALALTVTVFGALQGLNERTVAISEFNDVRIHAYSSQQEFLSDLKKPYKITEETDGTDQVKTSVDNAASYMFSNVVTSKAQLGPVGFPIYVLKTMGLIFLPVIAAVVAIMMGTYDFKYGTLKRKLGTSSWRAIILGKVLAIAVITAGFYLSVSLISMISCLILPNFAAPFDLSKYGNLTVTYSISELLSTISITFFVGLIFALIMGSLGLLIKNSTVVIVPLFLFYFAVPNLGAYDLRNGMLALLSTVGKNLVAQPTPFFPVSTSQAVAVVLAWLALVLIISFGFLYKFLRYKL